MAKKVKISGVKRSQHVKNKKNFARPTKKQAKATKSTGTTGITKGNAGNKKVFGKPIGLGTAKRNASKGRKDAAKTKALAVQKVVNHRRAPANGANKTATEGEEDEEDDEHNADDLMGMLDDEDAENINHVGGAKRQRSADDEEDGKHHEDEYTHDQDVKKRSRLQTVDLLPIKTKTGEIITRSAEVEVAEKKKVTAENDDDDEEMEEEIVDSDDDIVNDTRPRLEVLGSDATHAISTTDLLIYREHEINRQKFRIANICSSILENPENKMKNFGALLELMDERINDMVNLFSVRKLAITSLLEVFKDILPEYRIGQLDLKKQTVKKTTMQRVSYEDDLLLYYRKYLQRLEKLTSSISKGQRKVMAEYGKMAEIAATCLCELLLAHPYFNFGQNIAQLLVYLLNCGKTSIREQVMNCFKQLFQEDSRFDLSLFVIRRLNHLIKSKSNNVHPEVLKCLLTLRIKSINLNDEKDKETKQKRMQAHKARLINMSKKERKRMKKLKELERDLMETRAEENKQLKHTKLTEITKMVFTIYFRILKNDPNSQLLGACLEGLAEFAHTINLDFFSDLIEVLNRIMETHDLGYRQQLHCIQTVFTILSGQGEVLNIDPLRFYGHLYRNLLVCSGGKNHEDFKIILRTLTEILVKRRKSMTQPRLVAFIKRITVQSMQLTNNGTLATLGVIKAVMQLTTALSGLLDTDTSIGSGTYDPYLDDPEYCNANCTALYELATLSRHFHPMVRKLSTHLRFGAPATGEGSIPPEIGSLTPQAMYEKFDCSEMAFNPPIAPPRNIDLNKTLKGRHIYLNDSVSADVDQALAAPITTDGEILDFYHSVKESNASQTNGH